MRTACLLPLYFLVLLPAICRSQFSLLGSASDIGGDCYKLTGTFSYQLGAAYYDDKVDLDKSFELSFSLNFGCSDAGADGIYCMFQNEGPLALGSSGGYMGFGGTGTAPVDPSVGIEFDTYPNYGTGFNDLTADHLGIMKNGSVDHLASLAGPVNILSSGGNVEDCSDRDILISWEHNTQTISVYVDCDLRLSYTGDIVNDIFSGENLVYLAFSSGTGSLSNNQSVCFNYLKYISGAMDTSLCEGDTITLDFMSDITDVTWSPALYTADVHALQPDIYPNTDMNFIASITGGCGQIYTDTTFADVFTGLGIAISAAICTGDSYTLPGGAVVSVAGVYTDSLVSSGGCDSVLTTTLTINPVYDLDEAVDICDGDSYILPDGTPVTLAGSYVSNLNTVAGCDSIITTTISVTPLSYSAVSDAICSGDFYFFADGSSTASAGTYVTTIPAASGCDSIITTTLAVHPVYSITQSVDICTGSTYVLPDGTLATGAGTYYSYFSSIHGCDSTIITTVNEMDVIYATADVAICAGNSYTLPDGAVVTTGGSYITHYFTVGGCDSVITTNLTVNPNPVISFSPDAVICIEEGNYMLNATPAGGYYTGDHVTGDAFSAPGAGVGGPYAITYYYTDANGCSDTATAFVSVDANLAEAFGDTTVVAGNATEISGSTGGDYTWTPAEFVACPTCAVTLVMPQQTTTYTLGSVNENGCYASDAVTITVLPDPGEYIFVPNAFTPNADGSNDYFFAYGPNLAEILDMHIYDRWGEVLFERQNIPASDLTLGWNGSRYGQPLNNGVYAYTLQLQFTDGSQQFLKGNVSIVK